MNRIDLRGDWLQWLASHQQQVFFLVWAVIVGLCVLGMMSYYRRYTRSNFRAPGERRGDGVPSDLRRLNPNDRKPGEGGGRPQ